VVDNSRPAFGWLMEPLV